MTDVTTSSLPKNSKALQLAKLLKLPDAEQQLHSITDLLHKAKELTTTLENQIQLPIESNTNANTRRHAIILFQLTTAFIAHNVLNVISDFQRYASTMKGTDIFDKLEVDLITMNYIIHQYLDIFTLCTTYFRICDVKSDDTNRNQLIRLHQVIEHSTDSLQHTAAYFVDTFSVAMGSATAANSVAHHVKKVIKNTGLWSAMMKSISHVIHSGATQNTLTALKSPKSLEIMHWIFRSARLFVPSFIPDSIDALLTTMLESKPGTVMQVLDKTLSTQERPRSLGEFGTLTKIPRIPEHKSATVDY